MWDNRKARKEITPYAVHNFKLSWTKNKKYGWKYYSKNEAKWVEIINEKADLKNSAMESNFGAISEEKDRRLRRRILRAFKKFKSFIFEKKRLFILLLVIVVAMIVRLVDS